MDYYIKKHSVTDGTLIHEIITTRDELSKTKVILQKYKQMLSDTQNTITDITSANDEFKDFIRREVKHETVLSFQLDNINEKLKE